MLYSLVQVLLFSNTLWWNAICIITHAESIDLGWKSNRSVCIFSQISNLSSAWPSPTFAFFRTLTLVAKTSQTYVAKQSETVLNPAS